MFGLGILKPFRAIDGSEVVEVVGLKGYWNRRAKHCHGQG